ncbi:hypothetical protein COV81_01855 [Candidatus Peregrinibacteria bacterium CG11_big_fil_rev_8_21_14_0_20_41_10]|nr:MAG: hypothetical protein COV81_01855 [Candidatus Peregrinibacteria bacterium CG11_big_fil_rev_8_21_14_0_20_41_10]PIZ77265.1 MAG: hypothetical protein COY06_00800 [Candidatus Peregrinibacteria bacterium CG_4_10_14_0_2_um_filter_41_8]PJC37733.1 MAG: hypothetical protein CO045_03945 [Candidatus Peregrinibacteria bacterium CG_4_9_14_0_2_um_filter_41_14]
MSDQQIALALKDLRELQLELKVIKKSIKGEEQITDAEYLELKKAYKQLREQMKDYEAEALKDLYDDNSYNELIKLKIDKEEKIAHANQRLFEQIAKLPQKPYELKMETEDGHLAIHINPEMRVYVNGKEEKKRV